MVIVKRDIKNMFLKKKKQKGKRIPTLEREIKDYRDKIIDINKRLKLSPNRKQVLIASKRKYNELIRQLQDDIQMRKIPILLSQIKVYRDEYDRIAEILIHKKTPGGKRMNDKVLKDLVQKQRDHHVRAWELEKVVNKIKRNLKEKKNVKPKSLSDYDIDNLWSSDKNDINSNLSDSPWVWVGLSSDAKAGVPGHAPTMHIMRSDVDLNIYDKPKKVKGVLSGQKKKKELMDKLSKLKRDYLERCVKYNIKYKIKNWHLKGVGNKKMSVTPSPDTKSSQKKESLKTPSPNEVSSESLPKKEGKKINPKLKAGIRYPMKYEKLVQLVDESEDPMVKKGDFRKLKNLIMSKLKKVKVEHLRKCVRDEMKKSIKITKKPNPVIQIQKSISEEVTIEPEQNKNAWLDIIKNLGKSQPDINNDALKLLNKPPAHFIYGRVDKLRIYIETSLSIDMIKPTGKRKIEGVKVLRGGSLGRSIGNRRFAARPKPGQGLSDPQHNPAIYKDVITKEDVLNAYKDKYYTNMINYYTGNNIKFFNKAAQDFAYNNKIDVSVVTPVKLIGLKAGKNKKANEKNRSKAKKLHSEWLKGITVQHLKDYLKTKEVPEYVVIRNNPLAKEATRLIKSVKLVGQGEAYNMKHEILEKDIKKLLLKMGLKIKDAKTIDDKIITLKIFFGRLRESLVVLREKKEYVPLRTPNKTKDLIEPWDI